MSPALQIPEGGYTPPVALTFTGIIRDRAAMELVNMVVGLAGGVFLMLPMESLEPSPAFNALVHVMPEWFWATVLLAWGTGTSFVWLCPAWMRCRTLGMLGSLGLWAGLAIVTSLSSDLASPIAIFCVGQAVGCWWTYRRLVGQANALSG